ncbi:hypothetical protein VTO42DRAFT_5683 [Malbranchea cinnamomea]
MFALSRLCCCFPIQPGRDAASRPTGASPPLEPIHPSGEIRGEYDMDQPYWPTCPLPRYTPRPISIYEKTIVFSRGPNADTQPTSEYPRDEKRQPDSTGDQETHTDCAAQNTGGDHSSDASSTFSIPSSYGNTSTATRSPPPPYSDSCATSQRTPSICLTTTETTATQVTLNTGDFYPAVSPLQHPQPVLSRGRDPGQWMTQDTDCRRSWDSQRSTPVFPPAYSRT